MNLKDITPIQIFGGILVVNTVLAGGTTQLTDLFGAAMANHILSVCILGSGICGGFIMQMGGMGSQVRNVLGMTGVEKIDINGQANAALAKLAVDPTLDKIAPTQAAMATVTATAKAAVILFAFIVAGLMLAPPASAAQLKPLQITGHIRADAKANLAAAKAVTAPAAAPAPAATDPNVVTTIDSLLTKLESISNKVVTDVVTDIQAADTDAGAVVIPATATAPAVVNDPISHACYPAAVQFLQSLPVAKPTTGTLVGVQLFQKKRDFVNQLKAGLPAYLKIGCGALVGDEVQIFITMMGMVGVTVATGGITGLLPAATLLPAIPALTL